MMFKLGDVKIPNDNDFETVKKICTSEEGWSVDLTKGNYKVMTKKNDLSQFKMLKAIADYPDVSPETLYCVVQDCDYREQWDDRMHEGYEICYISPNSFIDYYALKSPKPFKNRDFVTQRCWLDYGENRDKIVFNHSINHAKCPQKKNIVRGLSFLTATYIKANSPNSCTFYYVTQADPGSSVPTWLVNQVSKIMAPKILKKFYKACLKYDKWKSKNNPHYKPWANPDQFKIPRIDWSDILPLDRDEIVNSNSNGDESQIAEKDLDKTELEDGE